MADTNPVKPLKIGKLNLKNNLILAPMAGITGYPFRQMCYEGGAGLVVGEMVSASALKYGNKRTDNLLYCSGNTAEAIQIFGSDGESIKIASLKAEAAGAVIVDINAGCPVKKIVKSGAGISLMKDEKKFAEVVRTAARAVKIPVTVKLRIGLKKGENLATSFARIAENEGAKAVCVHARYASQFHSGPVDLNGLSEVCQSVKIPIIGNGGICDFKTAKDMFKTGMKGIMIGRAAIGFPDIFNFLTAKFKGEEYPLPDAKIRINGFLDILNRNVLFYGEKTGLLRTKKLTGWWVKGFKNAAEARVKFLESNNLSEAKEALETCRKTL